MKGASQCAQRLKQLFRTLRSKHGKAPHRPPADPIAQLILGVFSRDQPEARAAEMLDRLRSAVVDYNELRVISPLELAAALPECPDKRLKCEDLSRALNKIFAIEHTVSLERAANMSRKDMLAYLLRIDGLEAYTRARIRLLGFGQHAIPLDSAMWAHARSLGIVDRRATHEDAQTFLERHIGDNDAYEFFRMFEKAAWAACGALVRKGQVEKIRSIPPDRTTRNMLQLVTAAAGQSAADDEDEPAARARPRGKLSAAAPRPTPKAPPRRAGSPTKAAKRPAARNAPAARPRHAARKSRSAAGAKSSRRTSPRARSA
jgi:endonuclease III